MLKLYNVLTKFIFTIIIILISHNTYACGYDFVSDCATHTQFSVNGTQTAEFLNSTCPYGTAFPADFGSNITTFKLTYGLIETWESCTNNVMESSILYRIYDNSMNKGSFTTINLALKSSGIDGAYRPKSFSDMLNTNLLTNLNSNTNYTIEIYFKIGIDTDNNGVADATRVRDNAGAYYSATFQTGNLNILPIELVNFKAEMAGNNSVMNWSTASENNNNGFYIERSSDSQTFNDIGFVKSQGNIGSEHNYIFIDKSPLNIGYYRLRQMDYDGTISYSNIVSVLSNKQGSMKVYPSHTEGSLFIETTGAPIQNINVISSIGQLVLTKNTMPDELNLTNISLYNLPVGVYIVSVKTAQGIFSEKIFKLQ